MCYLDSAIPVSYSLFLDQFHAHAGSTEWSSASLTIKLVNRKGQSDVSNSGGNEDKWGRMDLTKHYM